jgi:O-methyltransferase
MALPDKLSLLSQLYLISGALESPHSQREIIAYLETILSLTPNSKGVVVEAGCYKGSSTAKFSLAADVVGKELVVFDSFQGIPANEERHERSIFGGAVSFTKGQYCGSLAEVTNNVERYGKINCCRFVPGWFDKTLPGFTETVAAIYLDVDLADSTRTCLKYLYPRLEMGGVLYSQDGHLPLVIAVFDDDEFWVREVGCRKPKINGLGKRKLIRIIKER